MSIFTGSGVAIVTPFTSTGVDFDSFGRLIDFQLENHTDALIVCGTTGEPSTQTDGEKAAVIEFAVKRVAGRIPVIAGTGGNNTAKVISDSLQAQRLGADALLVVTPYYNKCTQNGLIAHFLAVADAVELPVIIYNVPSRTGLNMTPATLSQLAAHPRIQAMKEASGDIKQICEMARLCAGRLDIYSGDDFNILPVLSLGGIGVISVAANIAPRDVHDLTAHYMAGDIEAARALQFKLMPLVAALFSEVSPIPVKTALNIMGYNAGVLRLPLCEMEEKNLDNLRQQLIAYSLI